MAGTFSLSGKIGLDSRDFVKGADKAADSLDDLKDELDDLPAEGKKAGSQTGMNLSDGLTSAFAAAGGAALIGVAFNEAMNIEAGVDRVTGQYRLTADEAERYGRLGGDLYADAWGDSVKQTTGAIAEVGRELNRTGELSDDAMAQIATGAIAVADTFGEDVNAVIRSTSQLLINGLAPDAETALDMVTAAFQDGGNKAGDLLDTIDEYSQHWAAFGISGDEALGLVSEGFEQGFRDSDKLADAIKEMRLRTVEDIGAVDDAYQALGLDADATREAILAGGPAARTAFDQIIRALRAVEDPTEQNALAVQLIGTQYEDLGPKALDVLATVGDGLGDVTGRTEELAETVSDNAATAFEELKRTAMQSLTDVADNVLPVIGVVNDLNNAVEEQKDKGGFFDSLITSAQDAISPLINAGDKIDEIKDFFGGAEDAGDDLADSTDDLTKSAQYYIDAAVDQKNAVKQYRLEAGKAEGSTDSLSTAGDGLAAAFDGVKQGATDADNAIQALYETQRRATEADYAAERALWDVIAATETFETTTDDAETAVNEKRIAELDAIDTAFRAVDALAAQEVAQREANGQVVTAAQKNQIWNRALGQVAGNLNGPVRAALDSHKAKINSVPTARSTKFSVDVGDAMWNIDRIKENLRQAAAAGRNIKIATVGHLASGGPAEAGQPYIVGEEGPELFVPRQSGQVVPANETAAMFGRSATVPHRMPSGTSTGVATAPQGMSVTINGNADGGTVRELGDWYWSVTA